MTAMRGRQRRIVWTDEGVWHWEGLELPPGIRTAVMEQVLHLDDTIDCRAVFGPSGLVGTLDSSPFTGLEDALIAIPGQAVLATTIRADGSFDCSADRVLASGEYLADTWLSDIQQRRSELYRLLLTPQPDKVYPKRPTLYAWADPVDMGFTFPPHSRIGSVPPCFPFRCRWNDRARARELLFQLPSSRTKASSDPTGIGPPRTVPSSGNGER